MRVPKPIVYTMILALVSVSSFAAGGCNPQNEKRLWRYVGMGAGAYFGAGATYVSVERHVPPKVAVGAVAGGVAGYFLGRSIDRSKCQTRPVNPFTRAQLRNRFAIEEAARFQSAGRWPADSILNRPTVPAPGWMSPPIPVSAACGGPSCDSKSFSSFF